MSPSGFQIRASCERPKGRYVSWLTGHRHGDLVDPTVIWLIRQIGIVPDGARFQDWHMFWSRLMGHGGSFVGVN
jgi:hypothetical protein